MGFIDQGTGVALLRTAVLLRLCSFVVLNAKLLSSNSSAMTVETWSAHPAQITSLSLAPAGLLGSSLDQSNFNDSTLRWDLGFAFQQ